MSKKGIIYMYIFEYDNNKSETNLYKHGIDFSDAQKLWNDTKMIEIPAKTTDEKRYLVIGEIEGVLWSGVITYRDAGAIRIISFRRSRKEEVEIYESQTI